MASSSVLYNSRNPIRLTKPYRLEGSVLVHKGVDGQTVLRVGTLGSTILRVGTVNIIIY